MSFVTKMLGINLLGPKFISGPSEKKTHLNSSPPSAPKKSPKCHVLIGKYSNHVHISRALQNLALDKW